MSTLTYVDRSHLPDSAFALPERRQGGKGGLPLTDKDGRLDPKHIGNAAARLSMMVHRGSVTRSEATRAHSRIVRAACKVGMRATCAAETTENPMGARDAIGDFVSAHPWATVGIAVGAGGALAAIAYLVFGRGTPAATTTTTTTTSTSDGATASPTTTTTSPTPTSPTTTTTSPAPTTPLITTATPTTTSSSSSAPSTSSSSSAPATTTTPAPTTPTFDAANVVTITLPSGGKNIPVGTSFQLVDGATGQPVPGDPTPPGIVVAQQGAGSFVAVAVGQAKIYFAGYSQAFFTANVVPAAGTAGVAAFPRGLLPAAVQRTFN